MTSEVEKKVDTKLQIEADKEATMTSVASSSLIPPPPHLQLHKGNISENWTKFKRRFDFWELAVGISAKDDKVRVAALLSVIGEEGEELDDDDALVLTKVCEEFQEYCHPRGNVMFETFKFGSRKQQQVETIDTYLTALRKLAINCEFADKERRLRDQVLLGMRDMATRERLLREDDPDLDKMIQFIRASETAKQQLREMDSEVKVQSEEVCKVKEYTKKSGTQSKKKSDSEVDINCKFCGREHPRKKESCPAWGKKCNSCQKMNHFSSCCKQKTTNAVEVATLFNVQPSKGISKRTKTLKVTRTGTWVTFQIDTGASCNVISKSEYIKATGDHKFRGVRKKIIPLSTYGGKTWSTIGECDLEVDCNGMNHNLVCLIVEFEAQPLLSLNSSEKLGLVKVLNSDQDESKIEKIHSVDLEDKVLAGYPDVFQGLGKLEGPYRIVVDKSVKPVQHPPRRVPVAIRDQLKEKLADMEKVGVIEKVTTPTDWVSSMMLVKKPDKLRICLDPKDLNRAIKREHYQLPTIEEVVTNLGKARKFSVMDAKDGFHQIELDEGSSFLTTFNTPFGRFRWKRMPFGICSAPEVWQRRMHEFAEGLNGVHVVADDFLITGCGDSDEEATCDHDQNLKTFLEKARVHNLKMNLKKIRLRLSEVTYIGHKITSDGLKIDSRKVEAISKMPRPEDDKGVSRFLGMVQYLAKFLPSLSDIAEPMRRLTDDSVDFHWKPEHDRAFEQIKSLVIQAPLLQYYDVESEVTIQCDSSQKGIGAVLLQNGRPVTFSSRAMTKTEQRYAQIEKELLAIVHSCIKFHQYIYGRSKVTVESDHKPLENIFKKPLDNSPKRLQRMLLAVQVYPLEVVYKKGSEMYIADTLSRAYLSEQTEEAPYVNLLLELEEINQASELHNNRDRMLELRNSTATDTVMSKLIDFVLQGWPAKKRDLPLDCHPYFQFQDELIHEDGLLFKGDRVVIPRDQRRRCMELIHASHIGVEGCLRRAREYVFWPSMNNELKNFMSKCEVCLKFRREQPKEPMISHEVPDRPFSTVSTDIFELQGQQFLILSDHYSNWFEVEVLPSINSSAVIKLLKKIFARFGIPEVLISDNGKQFDCKEFRDFAKSYQFDHVTSSPTYPQSNGKAENTVKTCKQLMKKALAGESDFCLSLLDWRNTPSAEVQLSPAQRMFGRRTRTLMPTKKVLLEQAWQPNVKEKLEQSKERQAEYYNRSSKELKDLMPGDSVRMKLPGGAVWSKGKVLSKKRGRSYVIDVDGKSYRRNRRQLISTDESISPEEPNQQQEPEEVPLRRSTRVRRQATK